MGDGYNPDEPNARKFCEVIQIGIEDDTAEVTIFYTPERGLSLKISLLRLQKLRRIYVKFSLKRSSILHVHRIQNQRWLQGWRWRKA